MLFLQTKDSKIARFATLMSSSKITNNGPQKLLYAFAK